MYLIHGAVMYSTNRVLVELTGSLTLGFLGACAATMLVASISFKYFEAPVRAWINQRFGGSYRSQYGQAKGQFNAT
jgi:peptidoglycan/LPS O-acetylase OafA/YrhL